MEIFTKTKNEASISAKVIKKNGRVIDLGVISYSGPWYKVLLWKLSKMFKRRGS